MLVERFETLRDARRPGRLVADLRCARKPGAMADRADGFVGRLAISRRGCGSRCFSRRRRRRCDRNCGVVRARDGHLAKWLDAFVRFGLHQRVFDVPGAFRAAVDEP